MGQLRCYFVVLLCRYYSRPIMCTQVGDQDPEIFVPVIEFESVQCCFVLSTSLFYCFEDCRNTLLALALVDYSTTCTRYKILFLIEVIFHLFVQYKCTMYLIQLLLLIIYSETDT